MQNKNNSIIIERREKFRLLHKKGRIAYPNDFNRTHRVSTLRNTYEKSDKKTLANLELGVAIAGRIMLKRIMGKASFATVQDDGNYIQLFMALSEKNICSYDDFKKLDLGDIVGVTGVLFRTNKGELSIRCDEVRLLAKSLRPLPDKFHGLTDQEICYRQRYIDLIVNIKSRNIFLARSRAITSIRHYMEAEDFLEVETPMLHPIPGGATARPFITHHNTFNEEMYLRISPELYLKRLIIGGFDRVFEINRNFRNEGISTRHNPEFTMLEFYATYTNYCWLMDFTESLIRKVTMDICGSTSITYNDQSLSLSQPFARLTFFEALQRYVPQYSREQLEDVEFLTRELKYKNNEVKKTELGTLQLILLEEKVESELWQPIFITDYPKEVSPLSRTSDVNPSVAERFELFIAGREIANGFSELNDPEDQAIRFRKQAERKNAGDIEAMHYDAEYIQALEYGMPPTAGCGIGIDRLVMILTDTSTIRDVLLFPHLRRDELK